MIQGENQKRTFIQFIKFGIVGLSNTAIGLGTYYLFLFFGLYYLIANILSWIISVFNAFYWNNRYVFPNHTEWFRALARTYLSYGFSFLFGCAVLYALVDWCGMSDKIAPLLTLLITIPLNFVLNKFWTFK